MAASMKLVFAFCCAAIAVGLCAANTIPPQSQDTVQQALPAGADVEDFVEDDTYTDAPTTTTTAATTSAQDTTTPLDSTTTVVDSTTTTTTTPTTTTTTTTAATTSAQDTTTPLDSTTTVVDTTTTVAPQPPFYCHDCNSGSPLPEMWSNPQCTVAGDIDESYQPQYCDTFCFSSVGRYPAGGVYRGCASSQWFGDRVLAPGCFNDTVTARTVCLCAGDACNTVDLTQDSDRYVTQFCQDGGDSLLCGNTV